MITASRKPRTLNYITIILASAVLAGFGHVPILREIASFLIVQDPLRPAAAIVVLSGQTPFREIEAAKLYHAGWAPAVIIVREAPSKEKGALEELGIKKPESWELSRAVLVQQGLPPAAILIPEGEGLGTLEELKAVYAALPFKDAPVILVTSKYHTRRTRLTWQYVTGGPSQPIVRAASRDPFDPDRWWQTRRFALSVVREYLGLANYYAGFPVTP